jgi:broad specificity polyphosphatase/5'/3'-nucleotidase SurE
VAISTDPPPACKAELPCVKAHYAEVAAFVVTLVGQLVRNAQHHGELLPRGVALNINYPTVPPKGVRLAAQGQEMLFAGTPVRLSIGCPDCLGTKQGESARGSVSFQKGGDASTDLTGSDVVLYKDGYVTIVPVTADHTARNVRGLGWIRRMDVGAGRKQ